MFRTVALAGVAALALGSSPASPAQGRAISLEGPDCSQINRMYGDYEVGRAEQHATVPVSAGALEVRPDWNGGVRIERGRIVYAITACIGAGTHAPRLPPQTASLGSRAASASRDARRAELERAAGHCGARERRRDRGDP